VSAVPSRPFSRIVATLFVIIGTFENMQRRRRGVDEEPDVVKTDEVVLLTEIRDALRQRT
jgi:large-conductance mechanosensitive channel